MDVAGAPPLGVVRRVLHHPQPLALLPTPTAALSTHEAEVGAGTSKLSSSSFWAVKLKRHITVSRTWDVALLTRWRGDGREEAGPARPARGGAACWGVRWWQGRRRCRRRRCCHSCPRSRARREGSGGPGRSGRHPATRPKIKSRVLSPITRNRKFLDSVRQLPQG